MIGNYGFIPSQAKRRVLGYFFIILAVTGCSSAPPSKPMQEPAEVRVVQSYGAWIPTPYDRVAIEQPSVKPVAASAEQKKTAAYKLPAFKNSSSTVPSGSDAAKRAVGELACWLTFAVCIPASLVYGVYHVGNETMQNYKRRNP